MDADNSINIITSALANTKNQKQATPHRFVCERPKELIKILVNVPKNKSIIIYDTTHVPQEQDFHVFDIKDHINKSGKNWLRGKQQILNIDFLDITNLYTCNKHTGIVSTCLGPHYQKNKHRYQYPSTNLCNLAVLSKALGFNTIIGKLINCTA